MERTLAFRREARTLVRFALVGLSGVAVNLAIVLIVVAQTRLPYPFAAGLGIEGSLVWNYLWHCRVVFRRSWSVRTALRYHAVALPSVGMQWFFAQMLTRLGAPIPAATVLAIGLAATVNYLGQRGYTFVAPSRQRFFITRVLRRAWTRPTTTPEPLD